RNIAQTSPLRNKGPPRHYQFWGSRVFGPRRRERSRMRRKADKKNRVATTSRWLFLGLLAAALACQRNPAPPRREHSLAAERGRRGRAMALSRLLGGAEAGAASSAPASSLVAASASGGRARPRAALAPPPAPRAGEKVSIPAGRFTAGSLSGDEG